MTTHNVTVTMMNRIYICLFALLVFLPSCEKEQIELEGTIKGNINPVTEFGDRVEVLDRFEVSLEEADHAFVTWSDTSGAFEFNSIPPGTYNLVISKEGFYEWESKGIQVVGGDEPLYLPARKIVGLTETRIDSISLDIIDGQVVLSSEAIYYDPASAPFFYVYIHTEPNPSCTNYKFAYPSGVIEEYGAQFGHVINTAYLENHLNFSSGARIYVVVYPAARSSYSYFDYFSVGSVVYGLNNASNIASIVLP